MIGLRSCAACGSDDELSALKMFGRCVLEPTGEGNGHYAHFFLF